MLGDSARPAAELLPRSEAPAPADEKMAAAKVNRDKIRCLDGLRGIACLIVFNYHFLWPWTPHIMLGHGAMPPRSPEPYVGWPFMPIICLLHRGRPMVAIFFAISGYVLCRHILRAIHERRLDVAYQKLASSVFRRVFRLYLPPTISMFLVAMLAQMGAFKSEDAIFKGPDSVYINGTVTVAQLGKPCLNGTAVAGPLGVANYLGLESPHTLGNITGWTNNICLNDTSKVFGPSSLYSVADRAESQLLKVSNGTKASNYSQMFVANDTLRLKSLLPQVVLVDDGDEYSPRYHGRNTTNATRGLDYTWVQYGGSWEEHPFIHDNMTYALKNFTRAYVEWVNPFNFGHYHPRYDPHTFTIPMELRGSMFIYLFLLGTAAIKAKWRLGFGGGLAVYSLILGRWDMATFMGGTLLSEMDIRLTDTSPLAPPATGAARARRTGGKATAIWWAAVFVALYFLSYPDAGAEWTPGFVFLSGFVPRYYIKLSGWMFYQAMGALILVPCVLRSPVLTRLLEGQVAQYLGRISFSLYLVHGPVLHSLGFWIMPRLFETFGQPGGFFVGYAILLSVTLYLADWWYKKIDLWSTTVGRRIERAVVQ